MENTLLMKKLMKKTLLILATLLLVVACGKDDKVNNPPEEISPFPFLKLENSWTYIFYSIDTNTFMPITTEIRLTLTDKVDTIVGNSKYTLYYAVVFGGEDVFEVADGEKGILYVATDSTVSDDEKNPDFPLFWKDYTLNKEWFDKDNFSREIISTNENVTVGGRTFENCVRVKESMIFWLVRNDIGIVKMETPFEFIRMELVSKNF